MKSNLGKIPSGKVAIPAQHHLMLADMFHKLAQMHQNAARMQGADPQTAKLPSPDKTARDAKAGKPLLKQSYIGTIN